MNPNPDNSMNYCNHCYRRIRLDNHSLADMKKFVELYLHGDSGLFEREIKKFREEELKLIGREENLKGLIILYSEYLNRRIII